jgi:hypothetical protein
MKRPSVPVIAAASALLTLSGCYYYSPYGYAPYYTGPVPMAATQQETAVMQTAPNPAPAAVPDAQYPGPLYSTAPVAIAVLGRTRRFIRIRLLGRWRRTLASLTLYASRPSAPPSPHGVTVPDRSFPP